MRLAALMLLLSLASYAQTAGTVTYTGPTPARIFAATPETTPTISCTVVGNAAPATAISISCTVNAVVIPSYTMPLGPGQSYTMQHNFGSDAVTIQATASSTGQISVQATANGSPQKGGPF